MTAGSLHFSGTHKIPSRHTRFPLGCNGRGTTEREGGARHFHDPLRSVGHLRRHFAGNRPVDSYRAHFLQRIPCNRPRPLARLRDGASNLLGHRHLCTRTATAARGPIRPDYYRNGKDSPAISHHARCQYHRLFCDFHNLVIAADILLSHTRLYEALRDKVA